jgi:hypothetical protein
MLSLILIRRWPTCFSKPNGTINNLNGFGTVSGARDLRIMQLAMRFVY